MSGGTLLAAPNWLGDLVMSTALLPRLSDQRPAPSRLVLSVRRRWLPLLAGDPRIDEILPYERTGRHRGPGGLWRLSRDWAAADCGSALLLPPSLRVALAAAMAGIHRRIGFAEDGRGSLLRPALARPPRGEVHYVDELMLLDAAWRGGDGTPAAAPMPWLPACAAVPPGMAGETPIWALAVGATFGDAKSWPVDRLAGFAEAAVDGGARVLLLGDDAAAGIAARLGEAVADRLIDASDDRPGLVDLVGRTDLAQVASLLKSCGLFVGNDSGLMHLSAALGTPTVGLFGSSSPGWTAPRGPRVRVVRTPPFACQPCFRPDCSNDTFCLDALEPAVVLEACRDLLRSDPSDEPGVYRAVDDGPAARPTLFLDRDGVLIADPGYLHDPEQVELLPGVPEALRAAAGAGFRLVCLTNQSGIGRGYYGDEDFRRVQARLEDLLSAAGIRLDGVYYCPHAPGAGCGCRKPALGLIHAASRDARWTTASWLIGDKASDVRLALAAGLRPRLVRTGQGEGQIADLPAGVPVDADLRAAVDRLLEARS